jgi:PAS domain S-box-containing protein
MLATCSQDDLLRMIGTIGVPAFAMDVLDDSVFRYAAINGRLEEVMGLFASQLQGKSPAEILTPAQAAAMEQRCRNCVRLRGPLEYEHEFDLHATHRWLRVVLVPLFDQAGKIVRLMGTVNDITEQKSAEQELVHTVPAGSGPGPGIGAFPEAPVPDRSRVDRVLQRERADQ